MASLSSDSFTDESLAAHDAYYELLCKERDEKQAILELIHQRKEFLAFLQEAYASDRMKNLDKWGKGPQARKDRQWILKVEETETKVRTPRRKRRVEECSRWLEIARVGKENSQRSGGVESRSWRALQYV